VTGIYNGGSHTTINDNTISDNIAGDYGGGIYNDINGDGTLISGNIISGNAANDQSAGNRGGGVYAASTVSGNNISSNSAGYVGGIDHYGNGDIAYNTIVSNTASDSIGGVCVYDGYPTIHYNALQGNDGHALYNDNDFGSTRLDARNNWWSVTSDAAIQGMIFGWNDDPGKGIVDYAPYLTSSGPDLIGSTKMAFPADVAPGDPVAYTITLFNQAPFSTTLVHLTDTLPVSVTYVSGSVTATRTISWYSALGPFKQRPIQFVATLDPNSPSSIPITNTAFVWGYGVSGTLTMTAVFTTKVPLPYDVALGVTTPPPLVKTNHPSTTYDPGVLNDDTTYYWCITATDGISSTAGPVWSFTTAAITPTDATEPVTYTRSTDGLVSGQGTSVATYTWSVPGVFALTASAANCGGTVEDSRTGSPGRMAAPRSRSTTWSRTSP